MSKICSGLFEFHFQQLYDAALHNRPDQWPPVQFVEFDYSLAYGHKYICRAPELPSIIQ